MKQETTTNKPNEAARVCLEEGKKHQNLYSSCDVELIVLAKMEAILCLLFLLLPWIIE
jgi:hypothetical protein